MKIALWVIVAAAAIIALVLLRHPARAGFCTTQCNPQGTFCTTICN